MVDDRVRGPPPRGSRRGNPARACLARRPPDRTPLERPRTVASACWRIRRAARSRPSRGPGQIAAEIPDLDVTFVPVGAHPLGDGHAPIGTPGGLPRDILIPASVRQRRRHRTFPSTVRGAGSATSTSCAAPPRSRPDELEATEESGSLRSLFITTPAELDEALRRQPTGLIFQAATRRLHRPVALGVRRRAGSISRPCAALPRRLLADRRRPAPRSHGSGGDRPHRIPTRARRHPLRTAACHRPVPDRTGDAARRENERPALPRRTGIVRCGGASPMDRPMPTQLTPVRVVVGLTARPSADSGAATSSRGRCEVGLMERDGRAGQPPTSVDEGGDEVRRRADRRRSA